MLRSQAKRLRDEHWRLILVDKRKSRFPSHANSKSRSLLPVVGFWIQTILAANRQENGVGNLLSYEDVKNKQRPCCQSCDTSLSMFIHSISGLRGSQPSNHKIT